MTDFTARPRTVYFIRPIGMRGPVKIGCSNSPERRRGALQTWCPFPLEIVAEVRGSLDIERRFHSLFRELHQGHEWFEWAPELQGVMDAVAAGTFDLSSLPAPQSLQRGKTKRSGWSESAKLVQSYSARIWHREKRLRVYLPEHLRGWRGFMNDAERMKPVEEFIADPVAHGVPERDVLLKRIAHLKTIKADWTQPLLMSLTERLSEIDESEAA
jgi:hypothetical protein